MRECIIASISLINNNKDMNLKQEKLAVGAVIAIIIVMSFTIYNVNKDMATTEYTKVETIEVRDNIQKLTDNVADTYRTLQSAELAQASSTVNLDYALEEYNQAVWSLNTYTQ